MTSVTRLCQTATDPRLVHEAIVQQNLPFDAATLRVVCQRALDCNRTCEDIKRFGSYVQVTWSGKKTYENKNLPELREHYSIWRGLIITLANRGAKTDPTTIEAIKALGDVELTQKMEMAVPRTLTELCQTADDPHDISAAIANQKLPHDADTLRVVCQRALESHRQEKEAAPRNLSPGRDFYCIWRLLIFTLVEKGAKTDETTAEKIKALRDLKLSQTIEKAK